MSFQLGGYGRALPPSANSLSLSARSAGRKPLPGETAACPLGKLFDEPEKASPLTAGRLPGPLRGTSREETSQARSVRGKLGPQPPWYHRELYRTTEPLTGELAGRSP